MKNTQAVVICQAVAWKAPLGWRVASSARAVLMGGCCDCQRDGYVGVHTVGWLAPDPGYPCKRSCRWQWMNDGRYLKVGGTRENAG